MKKIFALTETEGFYEIENVNVVAVSFDLATLKKLKKEKADRLFNDIRRYDSDFAKMASDKENFEKDWKETQMSMDNGCGKFTISEVDLI